MIFDNTEIIETLVVKILNMEKVIRIPIKMSLALPKIEISQNVF